MTRDELLQYFSIKQDADFTVVHVQCRPPEKSDEILVAEVGEHKWYCERPKYFWSALDQSLISQGYLAEQHLVYPEINEPLGFFDHKGRWWQREEMSSFGLLKHYLAHPAHYVAMMAMHTYDAEAVVKTLAKIKPQLGQSQYLAEHLHTFQQLYTRFYRTESSIFMLFDELAWQFRQFLLDRLPKELVNRYFPSFLTAEITKEALAKNYVADREMLEYSTTRGVLYAKDLEPRAFYVSPQFFPSVPEDHEILSALIGQDLSLAEIEHFIAYRTMLPAGFQINEESQYIESSGLSAHLGVLMKVVIKQLDLSLEQVQNMPIEKLIASLQKMV